MHKLIDTERAAQQPLDRAACSILSDRGLPFERASWQQCCNCEEWVEDINIEYTFECVLGLSPNGTATVNFELKTRYPAYTCSSCCAASKGPAATGGVVEDAEEAEQLCPLHVQAVYMLQGSHTADNMKAITKGFIVHCPDCGLMSNLLQSQQQVRQYIQEHGSRSRTCTSLQQAFAAGIYNSPAAFGSSDGSRPVAPEKVIKELISRLVVMTACHIVYSTRPPPTPIDQLSGTARTAAAATADLRSGNLHGLNLEGQQLLPYRAWAVDALSLDSDLLTEANWVRPSLGGLTLDHKPSLLDLVLAPPYIAVAEHDAGMTVDKLAVLLLRQQTRQQYGTLHGLAASAAAGERLSATIAATETTLANMLATDSVFSHFPANQRVQQFLSMAGIPTIGDVVYALAQPHVHARSQRNLNVCAVCGMTPGALKRAKRPWALHRCKYCIICTCQTCRQEQQQQQPVPMGLVDAAVAEQLCLWCQGHPDTLGGEVLFSSRGRPSKQQLSSGEQSADGATATAAGWVGRYSSNGNSWDTGVSGGRPAQHLPPSLSRQQAAPSVAGGVQQYITDVDDHSDDEGFHRPPQHYDLAVELATAAAAGRLGNRSEQQPSMHSSYNAVDGTGSSGIQQQSPSSNLHMLAKVVAAAKQERPEPAAVPAAAAAAAAVGLPTANSKLQEELAKLQQLQAELQQLIGGQDIQLSAEPQQLDEPQHHQQQQQQGRFGKRRSFGDGADAEYAPYKRQRAQQQQQQLQQWDSNSVPASASPSAVPQAAGSIPALPHSSLRKSSPSSSKAAAADGKRIRGPRVPRCGKCYTCKNLQLKKGCIMNRQRLKEGKNPLLPPWAVPPHTANAAGPVAAADLLAVKDEYSSPEVSEYEELPASPGTADAADTLAGLLLSAAGFQGADDSAIKVESPHIAVPQLDINSETAAGEIVLASDVGQALVPAPLVQQQQQHDAAAAVTKQEPPADALVAVSAGSALKRQQQQQQPATAAKVASADEVSEMLQVLNPGIALLSQDINRYCAEVGDEHAQASKTLQDIQQLSQQLADSHQQTGQQLFMTGLQMLAEIVDSLQSMKLVASKVALAANMQLMMPAAYCPNGTACSVFELLMCCWFKELQDTGLTVEQGKVAVSQGKFTAGKPQQAVAGLCQSTLGLVGQFTHMQVSEGAAVCGDAAAVQQAVVHLLSGAALLLLHRPEQPGGLPIAWRQCLERWKDAQGQHTVAEAAQDLQQTLNAMRTHVSKHNQPMK